MLQYFGKNSPVSMEVIYGPKINNQCENTSGEHEKKKEYFQMQMVEYITYTILLHECVDNRGTF